MKNILFSVLFLVAGIVNASTAPYVSEDLTPNLHTPESITSQIDFQKFIKPYGFMTCNLSAPGTLIVEGTKVSVTVTVTGPCDATLAVRMRACIAKLRASFK